MLLNLINRLSALLGPHHDHADDEAIDTKAQGTQSSLPAALLGETSWHGDHWANLLSSPMDARHYILEDWSTPRLAEASEA
jgi:hypothetical protein